MYFEENRRRPSKMGKTTTGSGKTERERTSKRQERHQRKTTKGQMNREENSQRRERGEHDARTEENDHLLEMTNENLRQWTI